MANFKEIINGEIPVLVDFFAEWCGPCKMMPPILQEVAKKMGPNAKILKVDVDKNPSASKAYSVQGVPTLIIFRNGKPMWRKSGVVQANELMNALRSFQ